MNKYGNIKKLKIFNENIDLMNVENDFRAAINLANTEKSEIRSENDPKNSKCVNLDEYGTIVGKIYGGLNGPGNWADYFTDLSKLINILKNQYKIDSWLIKLENDPPDDIFYAQIGMRYKNE